jgi:hypothetical protein
MDKTNPFNKRELKLLKEYVYNGIDSTGWLTSKTVFYKDKAIGSINFIISKERIYESILDLFNSTKKYWQYGMAGSFAFSFLIAIVIVLRYRSIQKKTALALTNVTYESREEKENFDDAYEQANDDRFANNFYEMADDSADEADDDGAITIDLSPPEQAVRHADGCAEILDISDLRPVHNVSGYERQQIKDAVPLRKIEK